MITDTDNMAHHPGLEELVDLLCVKTQNTDRGFFRTIVAYFFAKTAACMRATIVTKDRGAIPINLYALALASSGYGKGFSVTTMEKEITDSFRGRFLDDTMPNVVEKQLWDIANHRAVRNNTDPKEEHDKAAAEFRKGGPYFYTFDSGTPAAIKQLHHKLGLGNVGAINLQIDEIGSNLLRETEILNLFLELFDLGRIKQKLTKNTKESERVEEVGRGVPTNALLFGTPVKLFDSAQVEEAFYSMLEIGYARRCLFGFGSKNRKARHTQSPAEIYQALIDPKNQHIISTWSQHFHDLADPQRYGWRIELPDDIAILLTTYKVHCERIADTMKEFQAIQQAEMEHRYFKALKLAGAYAFIDGATEIEEDHLKAAIKLVEESGEAFAKILTREKAYMRLAKHIADVGHRVTHADLAEALPYYPKSAGPRNDLITYAVAWGYGHNIIIKKSVSDGIEFLQGETLQQTDTQKMVVSYSTNFVKDYVTEEVPFDMLPTLVQAQQDDGVSPMHWANHAFADGYRSEENVIPGFNMAVLDIDGGCRLEVAHSLLAGYRFMTYTTKRHTEEEHRFRLLLPINFRLALSQDEYKEFMNSLMASLPFKVDEASNQRSKKWESFAGGKLHISEGGELFDVLHFIPKTSKAEQHQVAFKAIENLGHLERWIYQKIATEGNRNNNILRYALALIDSNHDLLTVTRMVHDFNSKLPVPLENDELERTIMVTISKRFQRPKSRAA